MTRAALLLLLAAPLGGCGLHPLYASGSAGPVAASLARVEVAPIQGKSGWLMGNALRDRFTGLGDADQPPLYRLEVQLSDRISGIGVRGDDAVTRETRYLRARFQLVDLAKGTVVLDAAAGSDAGFDVVGSEYATIAAENTAQERLTEIVADQIVTRVAIRERAQAAAR